MQINQLPAYDRFTGALKNMEQALCRLVLAAVEVTCLMMLKRCVTCSILSSSPR